MPSHHFYGASVREALAAARAALGPNALVLGSDLVPARGLRGLAGRRIVRLTAAPAAVDLSADRPEVAEERSAERSADRPAERPLEPIDAEREAAFARLTAGGIDPALALATVRRLSRSECRSGSTAALRRALAKELHALAQQGDMAVPAIEIFIGPPGVGKTTTIAKIAAQECAAGRAPRGLIAADGFRVGAVDQLRGYASIIGSPFRVARTLPDLDQALATSRRPVLVDTAGRSTNDPSFLDLATSLSRRHVVTHLVLAAGTGADAARRLLDAYAPAKPMRAVITKVDETDSAAPLIDVLRSRSLPVSYVASGQRVPEDLVRATPAVLAALRLGESDWETASCQ